MSKFKNNTAKVVSFLHADAHLVLKSAADGVAKSEAFFVNKLTGRAKAHIIEDRHNKTEETQETIKAIPGLISASVSGIFKSSKEAAKNTTVEQEVAQA
jgi:uncharacterized protein YoxC